jgi:hypothetical protein
MFTTSRDGINWSIDPVMVVENGLSPAVCYNGGLIYLYYFNDTLALITSRDEGRSFQRTKFEINRISYGTLMDPCVVFYDGKFKMFFVTAEKDMNTIRTASSNDGFHFVEDINILYREKGVYKPDVALINNMWIMFITSGGDLIKLISEDGKKFQKAGRFFFPSAIYSCTTAENGFLRTYYTGDYSINSFKQVDDKIIKEGSIFNDHNLFISEPAVIKTSDSAYFMFYKKILPNDYVDTCGCEKKLKIE